MVAHLWPIGVPYQNDEYGKDANAFLKKYAPDVGLDDNVGASGSAVVQLMEGALYQAGDNLTRANVVKQAASLNNFKVPMVILDILASTGPIQGALQHFAAHARLLLHYDLPSTDAHTLCTRPLQRPLRAESSQPSTKESYLRRQPEQQEEP